MLLKIRALLHLSSRLFVWDFLTYPRCQRLFMRGFRFRSSLKKWPARKASGPERHPFDSAEPITTPLIPKHPESGCFADWFLGDVECFKFSDWITITIGAWSGRGWFEGDEDQIPNNPSTRHVRFCFLEENYKYQMPVRTEDLDEAIAEVIGTFDGVEEISAGLREGILNYMQRKDILAVLPSGYGKSLPFQLLPGICSV